MLSKDTILDIINDPNNIDIFEEKLTNYARDKMIEAGLVKDDSEYQQYEELRNYLDSLDHSKEDEALDAMHREQPVLSVEEREKLDKSDGATVIRSIRDDFDLSRRAGDLFPNAVKHGADLKDEKERKIVETIDKLVSCVDNFVSFIETELGDPKSSELDEADVSMFNEKMHAFSVLICEHVTSFDGEKKFDTEVVVFELRSILSADFLREHDKELRGKEGRVIRLEPKR